MTGNRPHVLGVRESARLIYGTSEPSEQQLQQVKKWLAHGLLKHLDKNLYSTTTEYVADFMASQIYHQQTSQRHSTKTLQKKRTEIRPKHQNERDHYRGKTELADVYQDTLKEYLLAFVFQRNRKQISKQLQRAVLLGQLCFLTVVIVLCVSALGPQFKSPLGEQGIVVQWIQEHAKEFEIIQWFPPVPNPQGEGKTVRVRYRYRNPRGKPVISDRVFLVKDEHAVPHDPED